MSKYASQYSNNERKNRSTFENLKKTPTQAGLVNFENSVLTSELNKSFTRENDGTTLENPYASKDIIDNISLPNLPTTFYSVESTK